jgi:hypothetical protein
MSFSPSQAAIEGFRLVGRRPLSFVVWSLFIGLTMGAIFALFFSLFADLWPYIAGRSQSYEDLMAFAGRFLLFWLAAMIGLLLIFAVLTAAVYRALLAPAQSVFAYMRLGGAELRLAALQLLLLAIGWALELVGMGGIVAVAVTPFLLLWAKILIGLALGLGAVVLAIYLYVRLCLAGPLVVAHGRLDLSSAWALTRGRFWPLLATGLLAVLLGYAVSLLAQMFMQPVMMAFMGPYISAGPQSFGRAVVDPWVFVRDNQVMFAVLGVLAMPVFALQIVVQTAPFAAAYRDLSESS